MTEAQNFAVSTRLFNEQRFLQGLQEIDRIIHQQPQNSVLYSNRALFLIEIGRVRQAIKDLKYSIELDNLNYISYFNLSSIHIREGHLELAAQDLHCALSAMYLIAGKGIKSYEFITKSIDYAKNNTEARVLKGLMDLENGKFKEAHEELVWACGIQSDSIMLARVRDLIKKIGDSTVKKEEDSSQVSQITNTRRLQSAFKTYKFEDIQAEIRDRIIEFNYLYKIVSQKEEFITQKIWQRGSKKQVFIRQKSVASQSPNTEKQQLQRESIEITDEYGIKTTPYKVIDDVIDIIFGKAENQLPQQNQQQIASNSQENQQTYEQFLKQGKEGKETQHCFDTI